MARTTKKTTPSAGLRYSENFIAGSIQIQSRIIGDAERGRKNNASRSGAGRILAGKPQAMPRRLRKHYLDAVALFSIFTTCTRRLASAIGWVGAFSFLLPYSTGPRSGPGRA